MSANETISDTPTQTVSPKAAFRQRMVMIISVLFGLGLITWVMIDAGSMATAASATKNLIMSRLDQPLMILNTFVVLVAIFLIFSPWGSIRLGSDDSRPTMSTTSWLLVMFSASVGAGMVYWAAAEAFFHIDSGVFETQGAGSTMEDRVMAGELFSYGFHSWACYSVVGVAIGYFGFRKKQPPTFSSAVDGGLVKILPRRIALFGGGISDCLAVVGMIFGIGGSIAAGVLQMASGFNEVVSSQSEPSTFVAVIVLAVIIITSWGASVSGASKGLSLISNLNIAVAVLLMLFILFAGDFGVLITRLGNLFVNYIPATFDVTIRTFTGDEEYRQWSRDWPLTYFLWSMSWSPFVGAFIAEVSKGRTIRETLLGTFVFGTILAMIWFGILSGWSMEADRLSDGAIGPAVLDDVSNGIFLSLEQLPFSQITQIIAIILAGVFLITTCAAGILILGVMSTGKEKPGIPYQVFWAVVLSMVAIMVILTNTIDVIRAAPTFAALPITMFGFLGIIALLFSLRAEGKSTKHKAVQADD